MLPASTVRLAPAARQFGHICRWLWLAIPEDAQQEVMLSLLEHPELTASAREEDISYRLRLLRVQVWDRIVSPPPKKPHGLRPSKLRRRTGYRRRKRKHDPSAVGGSMSTLN